MLRRERLTNIAIVIKISVVYSKVRFNKLISFVGGTLITLYLELSFKQDLRFKCSNQKHPAAKVVQW